MIKSEELKDSLRACEEIKEQFEKGVWQMNEPTDTTRPTIPQSEEIDNILSGNRKEQPIAENREMSVSVKEPVSTIALEKKQQESITVDKTETETASLEDALHHPRLRKILSLVICIFTALFLALLITRYVAHHTSVEGSSMEPALMDGDQIIVENISYHFQKPKRFDVITFPNKEGVNYIKRIIALPGERVRIADGNIYINGKLLDESYGNAPIEDAGVAESEITLGKDEFFVLGDNRNASIDSRRPEVGNVHLDSIHGKAWMRFFPFSKAGNIN